MTRKSTIMIYNSFRNLQNAILAVLTTVVILMTASCSVGPCSDDLEDHRAQVSTSIRYQAELANMDHDCGIDDGWLDIMQSELDSKNSFESMDSLKSAYLDEIHELIKFREHHKNDDQE